MLGDEFWQIAGPYLKMTARQIEALGDIEFITFKALAQKADAPLNRDCSGCIAKALKRLKQLKKLEEMAKQPIKKIYKLKANMCFVLKGVRYDDSNPPSTAQINAYIRLGEERKKFFYLAEKEPEKEQKENVEST